MVAKQVEMVAKQVEMVAKQVEMVAKVVTRGSLGACLRPIAARSARVESICNGQGTRPFSRSLRC
jgi:hypothetical protein